MLSFCRSCKGQSRTRKAGMQKHLRSQAERLKKNQARQILHSREGKTLPSGRWWLHQGGKANCCDCSILLGRRAESCGLSTRAATSGAAAWESRAQREHLCLGLFGFVPLLAAHILGHHRIWLEDPSLRGNCAGAALPTAGSARSCLLPQQCPIGTVLPAARRSQRHPALAPRGPRMEAATTSSFPRGSSLAKPCI